MPLLVLGSLAAAITVNLAVGATHPYPGVALGSGLLLVLERTLASWAIVLTVLVVGDQALKGRLPDEISGRGVRYATSDQFSEMSSAAWASFASLADRITELENARAQPDPDDDNTSHQAANNDRIPS